MDDALGFKVLWGVVALLLIVAFYRFITQRRQLASGREIGRFGPRRQEGALIFDSRLNVTTAGKWCRLLLTLKSSEAHRQSHAPKFFFEKVAFVVGSPYTLTIKDAQQRVVHAEQGALEPFVIRLKGRHRGWATFGGEDSRGRREGTVTLLEFLPCKAGVYYLTLHITEKVEAAYPGSASVYEVQEAELAAMEDVIPLSKTVHYPHQRVQF
jgi:hypothetical protein